MSGRVGVTQGFPPLKVSACHPRHQWWDHVCGWDGSHALQTQAGCSSRLTRVAAPAARAARAWVQRRVYAVSYWCVMQ